MLNTIIKIQNVSFKLTKSEGVYRDNYNIVYRASKKEEYDLFKNDLQKKKIKDIFQMPGQKILKSSFTDFEIAHRNLLMLANFQIFKQ